MGAAHLRRPCGGRGSLFLAALLALPLIVYATPPATQPAGSFHVVSRDRAPEAGAVTLKIHVVDDTAATPLPVRVVVTDSDGSHPDGSGHGIYADGRFFADGQFLVSLPPGEVKVSIRSGPEYVPLDVQTTVERGEIVQAEAALHRWFAPAQSGWYAGDNHVHLRHDPTRVVDSTPEYAAIQARANGLNWICEADGATAAHELTKLDRPDFLFRVAAEQRPGPYVGHINTPGITRDISPDEAAAWSRQPLPAQALFHEVHKLGGVAIDTHPLTPTHLRHWMGATEVFSDAVLGDCADLFDIDSPQTQLLWFTLLNLGNRIGCSSYTDSVLGRRETLSPGDRRLYVHASKLDETSFVSAMRASHTFATNGGPIFPMLTIDGHEPGDTLPIAAATDRAVRGTIHALYPLARGQVICRGHVLRTLDVAGRSGDVMIDLVVPQPADAPGWFVLRVEDDHGNWAITSPFYASEEKPKAPRSASAIVLEVANHTRFTELRREFFAHLIATASPDDPIKRVELLKNGRPVGSFVATDGDHLPSGTLPTTQVGATYAAGWAWARRNERVVHLQADWPVDESGWYAGRIHTESGRSITCNEIHFDAANPSSQAISTVRMQGNQSSFDLDGYGEDLPLADLHPPYHGDHWWYTRRNYWKLIAKYDGHPEVLSAGDAELSAKFRVPAP